MPATLYDYRQPHQSKKGSKPKKPIYVRTSTQASSSDRHWLRTLGFIAVAIVVVILSAYFLLRMILPLALPLDRDRVVVFIPTGPVATNEVVVAAFKPSNNSLIAATITQAGMEHWPVGDEVMQTAAWSQMLGQVVDQLMMIPPAMSLNETNHIGGVVWSDLHQTSDRMSALDNARLWAFTQTVPGSHQRWLEPTTANEWQRAKIQLKSGNEFTQCPVGVINTTSTSGLAGQYSEIVEQSGYPVVRLSDNQDKIPVTTVVFEPNRPECKIEAERLTALLNPEPELVANSELVKRHRAEIVILLGQDATVSAQLIEE